MKAPTKREQLAEIRLREAEIARRLVELIELVGELADEIEKGKS